MLEDLAAVIVHQREVPRPIDAKDRDPRDELNRGLPMLPLQAGQVHELASVSVTENRLGGFEADETLDRK